MNNENTLTQNMWVSSDAIPSIKNPIDQISDNYTDIIIETLSANKVALDLIIHLNLLVLKLSEEIENEKLNNL